MTSKSDLPRNITYRDVERTHVTNILVACGASNCDHDGIIEALEALRDELVKFSRARRLLIAYTRDNTYRPRHTLKELAEATGMSISAVRTAYNHADLVQLLDIFHPANQQSYQDIDEEEVTW